MRKVLLSLLLLWQYLLTSAQCKLDYSQWQLVLNQEFTNVNSIDELDDVANYPNSAIWQFHHKDDPGYGWGDIEVNGFHTEFGEYYDRSQVSLYYDGSINKKVLRLTAVEQPASVYSWNTSIRTEISPGVFHDDSAGNCPGIGGGFRNCKFKSGMIELRDDVSLRTFSSSSLFPGPLQPFDGGQTFQTTCSDGSIWNSEAGGYRMGIFEIRMKIPPGQSWPAFWLINFVQLNIYEGKHFHNQYGIAYQDFWGWPQPSNVVWTQKIDGLGLSDKYHTYTAVWLPNKITFFLDGREIATFDDNIVGRMAQHTTGNIIIASLQMTPWYQIDPSLEDGAHMDIEYIRVYKPEGYPNITDDDYDNAHYKTSHDHLNHDVFMGTSPTKVDVDYRSIAINREDPNVVFYKGTDNMLYYCYHQGNNVWSAPVQIQYNYTPPTGAIIRGDINFEVNSSKVIYKGIDHRLQYFLYDNGWHHGYIDNYWSDVNYLVNGRNNSLTLGDDGKIYYIGTDDRIRIWEMQQGGPMSELLFRSPTQLEHGHGMIFCCKIVI